MVIWFSGWVSSGPGSSYILFMCSLKSHSVTFSTVTGSPRFKERKHRPPPPPHISMNMCQHHTIIKAWRMGYILLWSSSENTLFHTPKYQFTTMKTGGSPTFGKGAKVKQRIVVPHLTPCLEARNSKAHPPEYRSSDCQSCSHWLPPLQSYLKGV